LHQSELFVRSADAEVKVEVNFVFRGTVMDPTRRSLAFAAQKIFAADIQVRSWPKTSSTGASWWRHWTASIRGTCSTSS
jgi:hypothetical protein